ncbi:MAG: dipeptidase [Acidobacteria bacterium]|nr:dipeptidase [Acidobacteriota bacterium]MBI3661544.1 dipeptidase [Acidobacteriota bacterium]
MVRKIIRWVGAVAVLLILGAFLFGPALVERIMNKTISHAPEAPSPRARDLHKTLLIADLHADSLLWRRNLLDRSSRGHVDMPRLLEGNVALQAFTIVTKVPRGLNIERNDASSDMIQPLMILQVRPFAAWSSLTERALDQATRLREFAEQSDGKFVLVRTAAELTVYLARRERLSAPRRMADPGITAGFLGVEGAHALDGDLANLDKLFGAGIRMMAPTHFFDNDIAGSAHGTAKGGLTDMGKQLIRRMQVRKMIVDLAHASPQAFADVIALATRPVVVSHTGVKGTCNNTRNLSDDQIKAVARTGGVISIGYWETAVCGKDAKAIARAIRYAASVAGAQHVALGSDYDGAITAPFDSSELVRITEALLAENFSEAEIRMIMGENILRVLKETLP